MRFALIAALLISCASPNHTYADGAPLRPPAPVVPLPGHTPPGTGLPEYWRPPAPQRPPEPVPDRTLPEDPSTRRGPGIWASKPPHGAADPDGDLKFLEIPLPPPDGASEARDVLPTRLCAGQLSASLDRTSIKDWALKLRKDLRRCIAACTTSAPQRQNSTIAT